MHLHVKQTRLFRGLRMTLLELVAALVLIGIMAAVAVSRFSDTEADLRSEAALMRSHLRFAQAKSMADNVGDWELRLTSGAGGSYTLYLDGSPAAVSFPNETSPTHTIPAELTLAVVAGGAIVDFDEWGSPGLATHTFTLSKGSSSETIIVTKNTGYVP